MLPQACWQDTHRIMGESSTGRADPIFPMPRAAPSGLQCIYHSPPTDLVPTMLVSGMDTAPVRPFTDTSKWSVMLENTRFALARAGWRTPSQTSSTSGCCACGRYGCREQTLACQILGVIQAGLRSWLLTTHLVVGAFAA